MVSSPMSSDKTYININIPTAAIPSLAMKLPSDTETKDYPTKVLVNTVGNTVPSKAVPLGIIPPVVRAFSPNHDDFIFERPPHMHETKQGGKVAVPWTVFRIIFDKITDHSTDGHEFHINHESRVYWESSPAVTKDHKLIAPRFRGVYTDGIFLQVMPRKSYVALNAGDVLKQIMSDLLTECVSCKPADLDAVIPGWTKMSMADAVEMTAENKITPSGINGLSYVGITFGDLIEDMKKRYSASNSWIETAPMPFTHLLEMGIPEKEKRKENPK